MEQLKKMKECLTGMVESQVYGNIDKVDAKELGEAVDMIKDLAEAIYYCTITEAMEGEEKEGKGQHGMMYYNQRMTPMYHYPYPVEYYDPRYRERYNSSSMYAQNGGNSGGSSSNGGNSGSSSYSMYNSGDSRDYPQMEMMRDPREGRSGQRRKMYIEGQVMHKDKSHQMQELEAYMQELSSDMTEMISNASPEEKSLLQQKLATLAQKIK